MKLQLALDTADLKKAKRICEKTKRHIDIIELGTPLIKANGLAVVKKFKKFRKPILADLKTMDTGFFEAELAFRAGADITTVCAAAGVETVKGALKAAKKYKKQVMVDLIGIKNRAGEAKKLMKLKLKPDYVAVHTGIDMQNLGGNPLKDLKGVSKAVNKKCIAVAGGINQYSILKIRKYKPEIVVVGGAITKAKNPAKVAKSIKEKIKC